MQKMRLFWLVPGLLLLWVAGCGPAENFTTFREEVGGLDLSLEYPSAWLLNSSPANGVILYSKPVEGDTAVSSTSQITIRTLPASTLLVDDLAQLMKLELDTMRIQQPLNLQGEISPTTINDQEGVTAVLNDPDGSTVHYTILRTETALLFIFAEIGADVVENDTPLVQRTMNSVTARSLIQ